MKHISDIVEEVVKGDPRLYEALAMGIVNNHSLARRIQNEVAVRCGHNPRVSTIAVSIQRLSSKIKNKEVSGSYKEIFSTSRLQFRDDIVLLYLQPDTIVDDPGYNSLFEVTRGFHVKIQGIGVTTILVGEEDLKKITIKKEDVIQEIKELSAIIITSPKEIVQTPGIIAQIMASLSGSDINVVEVTSSYDNTFIIVEKKDSLKAVDTIRHMIKRAKND